MSIFTKQGQLTGGDVTIRVTVTVSPGSYGDSPVALAERRVVVPDSRNIADEAVAANIVGTARDVAKDALNEVAGQVELRNNAAASVRFMADEAVSS